MPRLATIAALVQREYLINRSYRFALVLDVAFGFLNLVVFFYISRTFGGGSTQRLSGASNYFEFAAVGIALSLVIQTAVLRIGQRMREEQLTGTLEALAAQPISASELAIGLAGFDILFATARATLYLVIAGVFFSVDLSRADWLGFAAMLASIAVAMMSVGIVLAAGVLVLRRAELLGVVVTLALSTLGGAVFPVGVLPSWLDPITSIIPTRFAFEGVRRALFSGGGWGGDAGALLGLSALAFPLAFLAFAGALALAKRRGSLGTY